MIPTFIPIWAQNTLMVVGAIALILGLIKLLFELIPQLGRLKSDFWRWIAGKWKGRKLIKNAIASDIETHVNEVVADLQNELPTGWIKRASIKWITEIKDSDLEEGEMILRIRPLENQDQNFLSGVYAFFTRALFPRTKEVIPANARKAAVLRIAYRTITEKKPFLKQSFEDSFLETAVRDDPSVATYLGRYDRLDQKGFFTGSFLREIHEIATRARFHELRGRMNQEIDEILTHIEGFITNLERPIGNTHAPRATIPPGGWYRVGPATSYAFLLVARPEHQGVRPYINRAQERSAQNIERLYVMGAKEQEPFARYVISEIAKLPNYKLVEIFNVNKDYRGTQGGIGALFVISQTAQQNESELET